MAVNTNTAARLYGVTASTTLAYVSLTKENISSASSTSEVQDNTNAMLSSTSNTLTNQDHHSTARTDDTQALFLSLSERSAAVETALNLVSDQPNSAISTLLLFNQSTGNYSNYSTSLDLDDIDYINGINESMSSNSTDYYEFELYRHPFGTGVVLCLSYVLVFILGLIGNCFVIAVVFRTPRMRTVTNYFIVNLAVADVLVLVFCLPATLLSNIFYPWMLGLVMCKTVAYVQGVSVSASVNSLVAVSLDRFLAIWFPLKHQITTPRARGIIIVIWIMAVVSAVPYAVYFDTIVFNSDTPDTPELVLCVEQWPSREAERLYFLIAHLLLCYLVPLVLISACYFMIWFKVARRSIPGDTRDAAIQEMQQRSKVKVIKMLVVVVIIFMLSWLPLYAIFTRIKLGGEMGETEGAALAIIAPVAQWLGSSNSCINPILYAFFNKKYRNGFIAIFKSRSCCGTLRYDSYSYSTMRRSCYSTYSSTIRPEGGTLDPLAPHNRNMSRSNVYTLEGGRANSRIRYHSGKPRSLANGLTTALSLAHNVSGDSAASSQDHPHQTVAVIGGSIEAVEMDDHNAGVADDGRSFTNGKLDAVG